MINYLNDKYFDELSKAVNDKKDEIDKKNFGSEKKKYDFCKVKPGDVIIAKSLNPGEKEEDNIHLYRPFFVVGKTKRKIQGIYCTTKKYTSDEYLPLTFINASKVTYLDCSRIRQIHFDDFKMISKYKINTDEAKKIINKIINYTHNYNQIDFNSFFKKITFNSIVLYGKELYKISGVTKNGYEAHPLKQIYNNGASKYINIFGKKYEVDEEEKMVLNPDKIIVITDEPVFSKNEESEEVKKNKSLFESGDKNVENYQYGDILSINCSKSKIIYLAESKKYVYYVSMDDIDFFRGISRIDKNNVVAYYDHLKDEEKNKLAVKIDKFISLNNDNLACKNFQKIKSFSTKNKKR